MLTHVFFQASQFSRCKLGKNLAKGLFGVWSHLCLAVVVQGRLKRKRFGSTIIDLHFWDISHSTKHLRSIHFSLHGYCISQIYFLVGNISKTYWRVTSLLDFFFDNHKQLLRKHLTGIQSKVYSKFYYQFTSAILK